MKQVVRKEGVNRPVAVRENQLTFTPHGATRGIVWTALVVLFVQWRALGGQLR
jgi:hypothetical protein